MAAILFHAILLFSSLFSAATAQSRPTNITLNSSLSPTTNPTSWTSPSGHFALGFYQQGTGFAVGVWLTGPSDERVIVWTASRDDPPVSAASSLIVTSNGLVLRSGGQDRSVLSATESVSYASMLDTGNFALYNSDSQSILGTFDSPTDTILGGQWLSAGKELVSSASETNHSTGRFRIKMQKDGNLVLYPIQTTDTAENSYWASGTNTPGNNVSLHLEDNGFMYLLNGTGSNIRNLTEGYNARIQGTTTTIYRATMGVDGFFQLYSHQFDQRNGSLKESWMWSLTSNICEVKGVCGLNSYCVLDDNQANCRCPTGFDFIDPSQKSLGCDRNFIPEECKGRREEVKYDIFDMPNTVWKNDPYAILPSMSVDRCREECLQDCYCEAALFDDQNCYKQKLPLQYWRRKLDDSTTAFVKFGNGTGNLATPDDGLKLEHPSRSKEWRKEILFVSVALVSFSFVVLAISGFLIYRHRIWRYKLLSETMNNGDHESEDFAPRPFTYDELEKATDGFKEELGRGGFGTVYRGILPNGDHVVAVKRLDKVVEEGDKEFRTEMRAIGRTHHRNLVRLIGYCVEGSHRLLVYEYMSNGSLANLLFSPDKVLNWNERVRIAMDIARGILYLHEECETPIIHCDIKPQNILMDQFHCAKISDFGLAKLMKPDQTRTFTAIRGTKGYVTPEWHRNMPVTVKADVYSFGTVLLEIVCCRKCIDMELEENKAILSDWVYDCVEARELPKLVDGEEVDMRRLERMVKVGLWCIQDEPSLRPPMKKVVLMLEGTVEIPTPPSPTSFLSAI